MRKRSPEQPRSMNSRRSARSVREPGVKCTHPGSATRRRVRPPTRRHDECGRDEPELLRVTTAQPVHVSRQGSLVRDAVHACKGRGGHPAKCGSCCGGSLYRYEVAGPQCGAQGTHSAPNQRQPHLHGYARARQVVRRPHRLTWEVIAPVVHDTLHIGWPPPVHPCEAALGQLGLLPPQALGHAFHNAIPGPAQADVVPGHPPTQLCGRQQWHSSELGQLGFLCLPRVAPSLVVAVAVCGALCSTHAMWAFPSALLLHPCRGVGALASQWRLGRVLACRATVLDALHG